MVDTQNEVLIIFKTHLDVGFTGYAEDIRKRYFSEFIPQAVRTAEQFRRKKSPYHYCWTVGSWLIYEVLQQGSAAEKDMLIEAIRRGDITYHALPFTTHSELMGEKLFRAGLAIAGELDCFFGRKTIAAKMTDVPGHTRGIIAPMVDSGVQLLQIGINPATPVPDVPPIFRWRDSKGKQLAVMYQKDYGEILNFPEYGICAEINVKGDNLGPHTYEEAMAAFRDLELRYPDRKIRCGTLDDLAAKVIPNMDCLPLVTSEIADTWIHGVGSDPWKAARFRALINSDAFKGDPTERFTRKLLEVAEHTWGQDEKTFFADTMECMGRQWEELKASPDAVSFAASWKEQRALLEDAVNSLPPERYKIAAEALAETVPSQLAGSFGEMPQQGHLFRNGFFEFAFSAENGAIVHLRRLSDGKQFASQDRPLGRFHSEIFTREDYDRFQQQYLRLFCDWAVKDFGKPFLPYGLEGGAAKILKTEFLQKADGHFCFRLFPERKPGMPEILELDYCFSEVSPEFTLTVQWFGKDAARIPHALWMEFSPMLPADAEWRICKNGEWISPYDVVSHGGRELHAHDGTAEVQSTNVKVQITSSDAALIAPGRTALLDYRNQLPTAGGGLFYNLYNNKWGTNFPMWFEDDMKFRFKIVLD